MLKFNDKTPRRIKFNGKNLQELVYNGVTVYLRRLYKSDGSFPITLEKAWDENMEDYKIYGESIQDGEPTPETPIEVESVGERSKNLFNENTLSNNSGMSFIDGYYTGSYLTIRDFFSNGWLLGNINWKTNTQYSMTYTIHATSLGGTRHSFGFYYTDGTKTTANAVSSTTDVIVNVTSSKDKTVKGLYYDYSSGVAGCNPAIKDVIIVEGSIATEYEPYGYRIPVKVSGKNLFTGFGKDYYVYNTGMPKTPAISEEYRGTLEKWIIKPNESFTLSVSDYVLNNPWLYIVVLNKDGTYKKNVNRYSISITYTNTGNDDELISGGIWIKGSATEPLSSFGNLQLERGEVATPYKPYFSYTENIYLNEPLRKTDDYADYIDFKNKKVIRNIKERILTGEEGFSISTKAYIKSDATNSYMIDQTVLSQTYFSGMALSNMVIALKKRISIWDTVGYQNMIQINNNQIHINISNKLLGITDYSSETTATALNKYKNYIKQLYDKGDPMKIYVPLANPTEESIELPDIPLQQGDNIIEIDTKIQPSQGELEYWRGL